VKCEVEFLAVGSASRAGDAIIVRYGETTAYDLMVVDGGTAESGETLVNHLQGHFPNRSLAHVVLTHSDQDHASGLREVLRRVRVANLWLHIPWLLAPYASDLFKTKQLSQAQLDSMRHEYDVIDELVQLAQAQGTVLHYPFQGQVIGPFCVLSPSWETYRHLLPQFDRTPEPDREQIEGASMWIGTQRSSIELVMRALFESGAAKQKLTLESWQVERLKDGGVTSPSNESSVVLYGEFEQGRYLLTGDAGVRALTWAADYAQAMGVTLGKFSFVQVPHHGSRRNVGPTILNRLLGPIRIVRSGSTFTAFVSAPASDDIHPRKMVVNAFTRRGGNVFGTQGRHLIHYGGFPARESYKDAESLKLAATVEEYD
jgi:beta-lactamase superfamily II metal-dependent hydrolase